MKYCCIIYWEKTWVCSAQVATLHMFPPFLTTGKRLKRLTKEIEDKCFKKQTKPLHRLH